MKDKMFVLAVLLLFLYSCVSKEQEKPVVEMQVPKAVQNQRELIEGFYKHHVPDGDFDRFDRVVIINELGTCKNCNSLFAQRQLADIDNDSVLFIVSSQGARIDISGYVEEPRDNVIWDTTNLFNRFHIVDFCMVLPL